MKSSIQALADGVRRDPTILRAIASSPAQVAAEFNLSSTEAGALQADNFDAIGASIGIDRSMRASNHDDAYLS